mmetsp:Transcript_12764/g.54609  ORF Transcript_12764/g.54609 Transcript_12764/m.54609 type:complete len:304 (+) Transcript_12764:1823-2734(+)
MSSVGRAVNVNATVTHAMRQSRFTGHGCARKLSNSGFITPVGASSGSTPHPTSAPSTALGKYASSAPPPVTTNRMRHKPVTPCASRVLAPAWMPKEDREMTPATFMPPASPEQMFATPCAMSSLFESHGSPSLSAQKRHTAAPSRYVITPMAMPGTASALSSSGGTENAAGGHSDETSTEMAPTTPPMSSPLNAKTQPSTQHTSAEGNSLWIFMPLSMITKVAAAIAAVPRCHVPGCVPSQNAAVAKCPASGPLALAPTIAGTCEKNTIHVAALTKPCSSGTGREVITFPSRANPHATRVAPA